MRDNVQLCPELIELLKNNRMLGAKFDLNPFLPGSDKGVLGVLRIFEIVAAFQQPEVD